MAGYQLTNPCGIYRLNLAIDPLSIFNSLSLDGFKNRVFTHAQNAILNNSLSVLIYGMHSYSGEGYEMIPPEYPLLPQGSIFLKGYWKRKREVKRFRDIHESTFTELERIIRRESSTVHLSAFMLGFKDRLKITTNPSQDS